MTSHSGDILVSTKPSGDVQSDGLAMSELLVDVRACQLCAPYLPLAPKPILQASSQARVLIIGQAPGLKTHHKGIPFDDISGDRLRDWLNVNREQFYNPRLFAIIPMGFCFPGHVQNHAGKKQGDKPPRPECSATWHQRLLTLMPHLELIVLLGQYAIDHYWPQQPMFNQEPAIQSRQALYQQPQQLGIHAANQGLGKSTRKVTSVTQACAQWSLHWPRMVVLPHPSPRNRFWLKQHPEFEAEMLPRLRERIASLLITSKVTEVHQSTVSQETLVSLKNTLQQD